MFQESSYARYKTKKTGHKKPVIISYEEAIKARNKPAVHNRRPHHSRPQSSYEEVQTTEGPSYTDPAVLSSDQYISSSHSGPDKYKQTVSMAGYQGGMNPVFVSLDKEENRETMSLVPTLPPKNTFLSKRLEQASTGMILLK